MSKSMWDRFWDRLLPRLRWFPLSREGWLWFLIVLAMLVTGLAKAINLITLFSSLVLATIFWNWRLARQQMGKLYVERIQLDPLFAQKPGTWTLQIRNPTRHLIQGLRLEENVAGETENWFPEALAPGESQVLTRPVTFSKRGRIAGSELVIHTGFPMGLVELTEKVLPRSVVTVYPRIGHVRRGVLRKLLQHAGPMVERFRGAACAFPAAQTEFHGLRNYRPGDSPRMIHWRTSARQGRLMVREFEDPPTDHLLLVVEAHADEWLEHVIERAASVVWEWCRQKGDLFVLVLAGQTIQRIEGVTGQALAMRCLEALALEEGHSFIEVAEVVSAMEASPLPPGPMLVMAGQSSETSAALRRTFHRPVATLLATSDQDRDIFEF